LLIQKLAVKIVAAYEKIDSENYFATVLEIGSDNGVAWTFIFFQVFTFSLP
jgi:hypothetical protein